MRQRMLLAFLLYAALACRSDNEIERDPNKIILELGPPGVTAFADGATETQIYALLPDDALDSLSNVTFTTTYGKLRVGASTAQSQTVKANLLTLNGVRSRRATVYLISDQTVHTTQVSAKVLTYERSVDVSFKQALPQTIRLSASSSIIRPSLVSEVTFTAALGRNFGTPSIGNKVKLTLTDSDGSTVGNLRVINDLSDAAGQTSFIFNLPSSYTGTIKAVAESTDENNNLIKDMTNIYSIKP